MKNILVGLLCFLAWQPPAFAQEFRCDTDTVTEQCLERMLGDYCTFESKINELVYYSARVDKARLRTGGSSTAWRIYTEFASGDGKQFNPRWVKSIRTDQEFVLYSKILYHYLQYQNKITDQHLYEIYKDWSTKIEGVTFNLKCAPPFVADLERLFLQISQDKNKVLITPDYRLPAPQVAAPPPQILAAQAGANSTAPVPAAVAPGVRAERPDVKVNDTWVYESTMTPGTGTPLVTTRKVLKVTDGGIALASLNAKGETTRRLVYDRSWNFIGAGREGSDQLASTFTPALQYFDFPLFVGKQWRRESQEIFADGSGARQHVVEGKVLGVEKVKVPAGEFECFKVELKSMLHGKDVGNESVDVSWYSPVVRRSVKTVVTVRNAITGVVEEKITRLVKVSVH